MECARHVNYYESADFSLIKVKTPLFRPMRSVLFGASLNYEYERSMWSVGIILNDQVKTTISYQFPAIINGESLIYTNKLNLGEKLIKVPIAYRFTLLKNNNDYANLKLVAGINFIFFNQQSNGVITQESVEFFTLDDATTVNNLTVHTYKYKINTDKIKVSLEFGLTHVFRIGENQRVLTTLSYEQGFRFLSQTQTDFTHSDSSTISYYNSSRGSSLHLKFAYPIHLNFSK